MPPADGVSWAADLRKLMTIATPMILSTAAETSLNFADFAIVSLLGPEAMAGVQCGTMVFFAVYSVLLGIMLCVTTTVSQSFGAKRLADCSSYAWQAVWLCMVFGVLALLAWPVMPGLFAWFGHAPGVQALEVEYTRIRLVGLGMAGACLALGNFFNGVHQPGRNTISVIIANIVNIPLSYVLVTGAWGFPRLGVAGAAWGSVIATIARLAYLVVALWWGRSAQQFSPRATVRWDGEKMWRLVKIGWPSGVSLGLDIAAWSLFMTGIVGMFGTASLAASATCWRYTELSFMPALGIGFAVCTLVGKSIGEGRRDLARRWAAMGAVVAMIYMGALGVIFLRFGTQLMDVFTNDAEVIRLGAKILIFAALFQLFDAVALTYSNALRGAGDTLWPMVVGPTLAWTVLIGGSYWIARAHPEYGPAGPWGFCALYVAMFGVAFYFRWRGGKWESIDVIGPDAAIAVEASPVDSQAALMDPAIPDAAIAINPRKAPVGDRA